MTIHFDVLQILTYMLIISFAVFLFSGGLFMFLLHRIGEVRLDRKSIATPFFALVIVFVSFFFLLASSGAIVWLKLLATGSAW